ncbi:MAG: transglycosylase SLT domain-containing protein [Burkholderiaceae bacterium]
MSSARKSVLVASLGLMLLAATPARAEVWGYVDAKGRTHFADHQINHRYQLYFKGAGAVAEPERLRRSAASSLQTSFEISVGYKAVRHLIREAAIASGVDYELLKAVISTESNFNARAVSPVGAVGLMQLMPETAQRFGVKPQGARSVEQRLTDPRTNLHAGARYLSWLLNRFDGEVMLALAAYNAGEGAVDRAGRQVPNFRETQNYVRKVMRLHQALRQPPTVGVLRTAAQPAAVVAKPVPAKPL